MRGLVACLLGRRYWGCDLAADQVEANREQADIAPTSAVWESGDAVDLLPSAPKADFIFSCPPYGDLERYSDDPRDLSSMDHADFCVRYREIIGLACERLRDNRFACFVVGDFRDRDGAYRNFVGTTVEAFREHGLAFYNEAILITAIGNLAVRTPRSFRATRKLGKTHQNVLVFVKGDPRKATEVLDAR